MAGHERVICDSADVAEGGHGVRFRLNSWRGEERGFVIRYRGALHGFVNQCPHAGTELDWNPGEFFDDSGLYLICSTHGALFEPQRGFCIAGPCRGASLQPLEIGERDGQVFLSNDPSPSENPSE